MDQANKRACQRLREKASVPYGSEAFYMLLILFFFIDRKNSFFMQRISPKYACQLCH